MYELHSSKLKNISSIWEYGRNITYTFNPEIGQFKQRNFAWYYLLKVPWALVDEVYFETFFKSERYKEAVEKKLFSDKWEDYIREMKHGDFYILDARDYIWELIAYMATDAENRYDLEFYGDIFWIYHDLWHSFLEHLYTKWTFKHRDEMDASIFSSVKLLQERKFDEQRVIYEVMNAVKPLLKTWKYINKDDVKYFFYFMKYFQLKLCPEWKNLS